ncbi:MAG: hypothetical protein AB1640_13465 [bacterium]
MARRSVLRLAFVVLLFAAHAPSAGAEPEGPGGGEPPLVFERAWEPNQKAFTVLAPKGWKTEGGMFAIDPLQANGPGNSIDTKCDFTVKKDDAGSVSVRWLPSYNYADMTRNPQFAMSAGFFPPGSSYQGMEVKPMPNVHGFLQETFKRLHPRASAAKVVEKQDMPELADIYRKLYKPVNDFTVQMGLPPMGFHAGGLVFEYTEANVPYREALLTALVDNRGAAAMWSNSYTLAMRAPAAEAEKWKPVVDIIRQSLQFNPQWVAAYTRAQGERAQMAQETMKYIQRIDQEIVEHRQKTHAEIRHESYLFLTGQEEYVNPYTKEIERDSDEYKFRWTNFGGDKIYSKDRDFDPNRVRELSNVEWKLTPVRER